MEHNQSNFKIPIYIYIFWGRIIRHPQYLNQRFAGLFLPFAGVDFQNLLSSHCIRQGKNKLSIEPTWPAERAINRVDSVCRADDNDLRGGRK